MEPHEHFQYATVDNCYANTVRIDTISERLDEMRYEYNIVATQLRDSFRATDIGEPIMFRLNSLEEEIQKIKESLVDIQDSLRRLGLDDISERLGDLNLLLA